MAPAPSEGEMASDDVLGMQASSGRRGKRCRHGEGKAADPSLLTIDPRNLHAWFRCEACWLLLELGFNDARPYDDLYQYRSPIDGRLSDAEAFHHILRGRVLLGRRGDLWSTREELRGT
jgi:hypothetical protein